MAGKHAGCPPGVEPATEPTAGQSGPATRARARRRARFLDVLGRTGSARLACRLSGLSRSSAYYRRGTDPAFRAAWDAAREDAADALEAEAWRRAVVGTLVEVPITYRGRVVGTETVRVYSDKLLMLLMRGARPWKYGTVRVSRADLRRRAAGVAAGLGLDPADVLAAAEALERAPRRPEGTRPPAP